MTGWSGEAAEATNIPARIRAVASRFPDAEAIVDGDVRLPYSRLAQEMLASTRAAMAAGIEPGARAAIWAPNSWRWIVAALGVLGAGGVVVPVGTRFTGAEAAAVLDLAGVRILFTDNAFRDTDHARRLRDAGSPLPGLERVVVLSGAPGGDIPWQGYRAAGAAVDERAARLRLDRVGGGDPADILFTSGTTGRPKGVTSTHGQLLRLYADWSEIVGLGPGDRHLVVSPFSHSFGYKAGWLASLLHGATVLPMATFDVAAVLATVERERVTFLPGPPTLLQDILDAPDRDRHDLSSLRTTVTGAATVPVELVRRLRAETPFTSVLTGYGLTETNGPATISRPGDDADTIANFAGRALPDTEVAILDGAGSPAPPGTHGEIVIRGYHLMTGYLDDPAATAAAIDGDGWFHTGDVGFLDDRGYLKITGRSKEMYVVGGFNVYPAEVEAALLEHGQLARVAVVGVPDPRLGEVGVAFAVPRPGASVTADELIGWARERMAGYKAPRHVEIRATLPTNALGKVLKDELRASAANGRD